MKLTVFTTILTTILAMAMEKQACAPVYDRTTAQNETLAVPELHCSIYIPPGCRPMKCHSDHWHCCYKTVCSLRPRSGSRG